ncbi:MAG: hypothetical protein IJ797_03775, partial [Selenomonadaceae bacterium]|nr:hypothetical protein [Selenomonadaceae bacterium]
MASQADVIKKFVQGLTTATKTGEEAVNSALKTIGITNYKTLTDDYRKLGWTEYGSDRNQNILEQSCGVRVNNKDTGAITGSDAGGSTTKTSESIIAESSTAQALTEAEYNSFTKKGLTVNVTYDDSGYDNSNFDYDLDTYLDKQKLVIRNLYNWWIPEALDLINDSLGVNFTDGRANTNEINIKFTNDTWSYSDFLKIEVDTDMGYASNITWTINMAYLSNITEDDKNGKINEDMHGGIYVNKDSVESGNGISDYFDRVVARELANMTLRANISYYDDLPNPIKLGLPRLVDGYDENINYTSLYSCYYTSIYGNNLQGYTLLRYLAKQYVSEIDDTTSGGSSSTDTTSGGGSSDTVVSGGSGTATQTGGSGADSGKDDDGDGLI